MQVHLSPLGAMDLLSQLEVERLKHNTESEAFALFRNCCLAVLNVGSHIPKYNSGNAQRALNLKEKTNES